LEEYLAQQSAFTRTAALGKILTHDNLRKQNIVVVEWCYMCNKNGELVDHLLLHCEVANALWHSIRSRFGLHWVMPGRVKDLYASWWTGGRSQSVVVWKMIPLYLMWYIWSERNAGCFEDSTSTLEELIHFFLFTLFTWTASWLAPLVISFLDFLSIFSSSS
jgi:hypothetical protein